MSVKQELQLNLSLRYKNFSLNINTEFSTNGITAIFGRSGSGKTTLLRCIAGLEKASSAKFVMQGELWQDETFFLPPHARSVGYVFQEASLFSHLSIHNNLRYAIKRAPKNEIVDTEKVISLLGVEPLLMQYPHELSGGERQRVAIARALLSCPKLLLMDEPLASLDLQSKQDILPYLALLRSEFKVPILYVSHGLDEVARLADFMVVLKKGEIEAEGNITDVLARLDFSSELGREAGVVLDAVVCGEDSAYKLIQVGFSGGELWLPHQNIRVGESVRLRVLAKDISLTLSRSHDSSILNLLQGRIVEISEDTGEGFALVSLDVGGKIFISHLTLRSVESLHLVPEKVVWLQIKSIAVIR